MRLELTENDILLLKLAGSVLIAFLVIRFLLMPGIEHYQENIIQRDELTETAEGMQAAIDGIPVLEQEIGNSREELEEVSSVYYERMENHQVDELLTGLALKHGLFPVSLSIEGAVPKIPAAYLYGVTAGSEKVPSEHYIQTAAGNMVLRGEEAKFFGFLDDVETNYPALRLCKLQMEQQIYFDEDWNIIDQPDMSCVLEIYMHE
ncbi:MAG: hypothetical protein HFI00_06180 [Lachnospiraceae bacterium]|nr:hypothetical protein [Lachnospiraceae bacterium]MCI9107791.1 hypothetical protein [Lachnospiraceae bacterium]